jgi:hypothetical protein
MCSPRRLRVCQRPYQEPSPALADLVWEGAVRPYRPVLSDSIDCYRLQEEAFGGLKPSTRRLLARVAEKTATGRSPKSPRVRKAETGTILVREWQGAAHRVTVLREGVSFKGKRYRSLSEVAREITGSHWSGPRFFGLRLPKMENSHGTH